MTLDEVDAARGAGLVAVCASSVRAVVRASGLAGDLRAPRPAENNAPRFGPSTPVRCCGGVQTRGASAGTRLAAARPVRSIKKAGIRTTAASSKPKGGRQWWEPLRHYLLFRSQW